MLPKGKLYYPLRGSLSINPPYATFLFLSAAQAVIDADDAAALPIRGKTVIPEIEIDAVFDLGIALVHLAGSGDSLPAAGSEG